MAGHGPLHADPVAAHDRVDRACRRRRAPVTSERLGELVAELEDVPDLDQPAAAPADARTAGTAPRRATSRRSAQVPTRDVAADVHPAQVDVVDVGPGDHVPPRRAAPRPRSPADPSTRRPRPGCRAAPPARSRISSGWAGRIDSRPGRVGELLLVQRVVAAHQHQGELAVQQVDEGLDLPVGGRVVPGRQVLDGAHAGVAKRSGAGSPGRSAISGSSRGGLLHVGGVVAVRAVRDRCPRRRRTGT